MRNSVATSLALWLMAAPFLPAQSDVDAIISEVLEETGSEDTEETPGTAETEETTSPGFLPPPAPLPPQPQQARRPGLVTGDTVANIQFPNADVRHILAFYEQLTGKQVIYDNTVQGQINIVVNRPLSRQEAIQVIETALLINGLTLVPGPSDFIVKVAGTSRNARQFAIPIISDIADLPDGDGIVTFIYNLNYAEPTEVQQAISQYIPQTPNYTSIIPLPKTQSLMITESASVLRMIGKLIDNLDQPPAEVISEFISLERADAKEVVEKLTTMFEKPEATATQAQQPYLPPWALFGRGGQTGDNNQPGATPGNAATGGITLSEDSLIIGKIKLTADERTNRIHVVTRPANIVFIRRLIAEYDANVSYGAPARRVLRFVSAGDVLDVVVQAITEPGKEVETVTASNPSSTNQAAFRGGSGGSTSGGVQLGNQELNAQNIDVVPEARTVGSTRIIADKRANAIIVLGNDDAREKIFRVLDEIDVRSPQVMITAVIGELTLDDGEEFGVDYIYRLGRTLTTTVTQEDGTTTIERTRPNQAFAGISRNNSISLTDISTLTTVSAFSGMPAGATALIGATKSLDIIVSALESTGKFRVTSRPMIFASNNQQALITSGEKVAIPQTTISGFNNSDNLVTNATITYQDILLKLEVIPLINSDREVTLNIVQEVNNINGYTEIGGNRAPNINARRIQTTISVANEATIVLGGLVQESEEDDISGIPVLYKMPLVGPLFGHKRKQKRRTELVVLLRPTVIFDPAESAILAEREQEKLNFPPDLEASIDATSQRINANPPAAPAAQKPRSTLRPAPRVIPATRQ